MFGKKKDTAPLKNQPRSAETTTKPRRSFSFFKRKPKEKAQKVSKSGLGFKVKRAFISVLDGSFLGEKWLLNYAGLILFVFVLTIAAIWNSYVAQRKVNEIVKLKKEVKDLRDEYISVKSQLMYYTKMSEVARKLEGRGIKEPTKPAFKLIISKKEGEE